MDALEGQLPDADLVLLRQNRAVYRRVFPRLRGRHGTNDVTHGWSVSCLFGLGKSARSPKALAGKARLGTGPLSRSGSEERSIQLKTAARDGAACR